VQTRAAMQGIERGGVRPRLTGDLVRAYRAGLRTIDRDGPLVVACVGLVALGVTLRVNDLGFPPSLTWDEHHFVLNARNYIHHEHDWNDHPPLGKLLIAAGMLLLGDTSIGFRFAPLFFGILSILLGGAIAAWLFRDRRAGLIAAAFVAGDGFLIAYSRTALLDGMLATFGLASLWFAIRSRSWRGMAWTAALLGCAASIKLSGAFLILPVMAISVLRRDPVRKRVSLALAPVVYTALFMVGLALCHEPHGIADALHATNVIVVHHAALTSFTHTMTSHWYTWFLPTRPVTLSYDGVAPGVVRAMTSLGNLALWWAADIALLYGIGSSVKALIDFLRERRRDVRIGRTARANAVLISFALVMLAPWIFGKRDSYIYHYLPTYAFLLVLLAGDVSVVYRRHRLAALVFVLVVGLVSVYYAPVWGQLPITDAGFRSRVFLKMWL